MGVVWSITGIFTISILGILILKWQNPALDATFLGVMVSTVMGMAGFLVLHFKQQKIEDKFEKTVEITKKEHAVIIENQTKELKDVIEAKADSIIQNSKEPT